jgi:hypothetical protein
MDEFFLWPFLLHLWDDSKEPKHLGACPDSGGDELLSGGRVGPFSSWTAAMLERPCCSGFYGRHPFSGPSQKECPRVLPGQSQGLRPLFGQNRPDPMLFRSLSLQAKGPFEPDYLPGQRISGDLVPFDSPRYPFIPQGGGGPLCPAHVDRTRLPRLEKPILASGDWCSTVRIPLPHSPGSSCLLFKLSSLSGFRGQRRSPRSPGLCGNPSTQTPSWTRRTLSSLSIGILRLSLPRFANLAHKDLFALLRLLSIGKGLISLCPLPP